MLPGRRLDRLPYFRFGGRRQRASACIADRSLLSTAEKRDLQKIPICIVRVLSVLRIRTHAPDRTVVTRLTLRCRTHCGCAVRAALKTSRPLGSLSIAVCVFRGAAAAAPCSVSANSQRPRSPCPCSLPTPARHRLCRLVRASMRRSYDDVTCLMMM